MVKWKDRVIANFNTGIPASDGNFILSVDDPGVIQRLQMCDFHEYTGDLPVKEEPKPALATEATPVPNVEVKADAIPKAPDEPKKRGRKSK